MQKDYLGWHNVKSTINATPGTALFQEREIWWCTLGANVGFETDGGDRWRRPVLIIKKFNLESCLVVPLTGREKKGKYYFSLGIVEDRLATAVLSQVRYIDRKRLENKIYTLDSNLFKRLVAELVRTNFGAYL